MKIAFLTPEYPTEEKPQGGLATYLNKVANLLVERGHDVTIFFLSNTEKYWQENNIKIYEINNEYSKKSFLFNVPIVRIFSRLFIDLLIEKKIEKKFHEVNQYANFDILQIPILPSGETLGFLLYSKKFMPIVCRFSFYPPLYYKIINDNKIINYIKNWFTLYKIIKSDRCFSPCQYMADIIYAETKVRPDVIYSPIIKSEIFSSIICSRKNIRFIDFNYLLFFNQFDTFKGIDLIAEIINSLLDKYKNLAFFFVGKDIGIGLNSSVHSSWKNYIKAKCSSQYHNRIIFYPPLIKEDLFTLIMKSEAVLIPSRADNYPNACLEAHMLGVPVIGTYNSSLEEMIIDGKTGFLANNSDAYSLQLAIEKLLSLTDEQKQVMKRNIAEHVEKIKGEDRIGQLINFYQATITQFKNKNESCYR